MIYQRLTRDLKEEIKIYEEILRLSISPEVYCHNDSNRDAIARIHAFGEVTSTHTEMYEQVISSNKEILSEKGGIGDIENTILQAPFRVG